MAPIIFQPSSCAAVRYLVGFESTGGRPTAIYTPDKSAILYEAYQSFPDKEEVVPALHFVHPVGPKPLPEELDQIKTASGLNTGLPFGPGAWQPTVYGLRNISSGLTENAQSRQGAWLNRALDTHVLGQGWIASADIRLVLTEDIDDSENILPSVVLPSPLRCLGTDPEGAMFDPQGGFLSLTCTLDGHQTTVDFHPALFWTPNQSDPSSAPAESGGASRGVVARVRENRDWQAEEKMYRKLDSILRSSGGWQRYATLDCEPEHLLALSEPEHFKESLEQAWSQMIAQLGTEST